MRSRVVVLAGPSGSGKSQLARRLALPVLNLDDFYRDGSDPELPRLETGAVDWDDPGTWLQDDAVEAIELLCHAGEATVPVYDIAHDRRSGQRRVAVGGSAFFVAEGIFAQEIVAETRTRGLLADAICLHHHRVVTCWRRLTRDLREQRKPPLVLLRRGLRLFLAEPDLVARAVSLGCIPLRPGAAHARITRLVESARRA